MPVHFYQGAAAQLQPEINACRDFHAIAKEHSSDESDDIYVLFGVDYGKVAVDLIIMKRDAIIFADFKHANGEMRGTQNGPWRMKPPKPEKSFEVKGGNQGNPLQQLDRNKNYFEYEFKEHFKSDPYFKNRNPKIDPNKLYRVSKCLVIFTKGHVTLDTTMNFLKKLDHIRVSTLERSWNEVVDFTSKTGFQKQDLEAMINILGPTEYKDYSVESLMAENSEKIIEEEPAKQIETVSETKKLRAMIFIDMQMDPVYRGMGRWQSTGAGYFNISERRSIHRRF